jgi:hypothetical protein
MTWMACDFDNDAKTCPRCGFVAKARDARKGCTAAASRGFGDVVASGLSTIGITKERVSRWLGFDCKCSQRQAKWNELGWRVVAVLRRRIGIG